MQLEDQLFTFLLPLSLPLLLALMLLSLDQRNPDMELNEPELQPLPMMVEPGQ
jgi:hypothetical protein|uniref:Uncharacterized protein n=1 Tax=Picea glauca TaxID=3330 RepID=A0A101M2W9_PICGL|nr:hypothetical protein ABT39_MTgene3263 [Picea glauca]QHR89236.1 hypothetical protein Q903MT_gene3256 [Picea sitchensis]